VGPPK